MRIAFFETEDWERDYIKKRINAEFYKSTLNSGNADRFKNAEIISVFINSRVDKNALDKLKKVKLIATRSTGYDHIDVQECKRRKISVCYVPTYGENTVAEHTFGLILTLSRKLHKAYQVVRSGNFDFKGLQGFDLKGKTLGVVGTGNIGRHVIRIAKGFEMNVIAFDVNKDRNIARQLGFNYVSFNHLLENSDIITLHVPYNKHTHHMINISNIKMFKPGSLLINTSRGNLIQTEALLYGLRKGLLSGIGLDVLEDEQMIKEEVELLGQKMTSQDIRILLLDHILTEQDNVVITPHNAFNSKEALQRILDTTIHNIKSFSKHKKTNLVK